MTGTQKAASRVRPSEQIFKGFRHFQRTMELSEQKVKLQQGLGFGSMPAGSILQLMLHCV